MRQVLDAGYAAATILSGATLDPKDEVLRIAFDGDAVLFSDESEQVFQSAGLEAFTESEKQAARQPLSDGPFKAFLEALHQIQREFPADRCPIRTALVTARSAPAHERVVRTLREWGIRLDESLFLGGLPKGPSSRRSAPTCSSTTSRATANPPVSTWPPAMCPTASPTPLLASPLPASSRATMLGTHNFPYFYN